VLGLRAPAQVPIDSSRAAALLGPLNLPSIGSLRCSISPVRPAFAFSFRFQAGYLARVPLSQFHGPGHWISVLLRVTPEAGDRKPVFLLRRFDLPEVPDTELAAQLAGAFFVGEGHYQSNAILFDDRNRVCRADWQIDVKTLSAHQELRLLIPAETVQPLSAAGFSLQPTGSDIPAHRTTIFLHAAPLDPKRPDLDASDVLMAVGSLAALLERLPPDSVRLVVFNLRRQKELYRNDEFSAKDLEQVTQVLDSLQLGQAQVDYRDLKRATERRELLGNLVHREVNEETYSSDVIFLGPDGSYARGDVAVADPPAPHQHFFYLQYRLASPWASAARSAPAIAEDGPRPAPPCQGTSANGCGSAVGTPIAGVPPNRAFQRPLAPSDPDVIATAVRKLKGKILPVRNPADFANAVDRIELPWREAAP
jgi:hypothetical protein